MFDTGLTGHPDESFLKILQEYKPDLVAISALSFAHKMMLRFCRIVREWNRDTWTIVGGPHVNAYEGDLLHDDIDYLIKGEGEESFSDLCHCLVSNNPADNIPGLIMKKSNRVVDNPVASMNSDLDTINYPAWDLVDFKKYTSYAGFRKKQPMSLLRQSTEKQRVTPSSSKRSSKRLLREAKSTVREARGGVSRSRNWKYHKA